MKNTEITEIDSSSSLCGHSFAMRAKEVVSKVMNAVVAAKKHVMPVLELNVTPAQNAKKRPEIIGLQAVIREGMPDNLEEPRWVLQVE